MIRQSVCGSAPRVLLVLVTALLLAVPGVRAAEDDVPVMVRQEIESVLKKKTTDLLNEKDKDGIATKRGAYSRTFHKVDDSTYTVTFHRDTIEDAVAGKDQLKTERLLLTVKKDAGGKWSIAKEEIQDTYIGLYRGVIERQMYKFDSFALEKEGLKTSASKGYLYRYLLLGKTVGWMMAADDLKYDFVPPADSGYNWYQVTQMRIMRDHPQDIHFKPERAQAYCDTTSCEQLLQKAFTGLAKLDGGLPSGGAAANLNKAYTEETKDEDKELKDNPFGPFFRPPDADRRAWRLSYKRDGAKDHFFTFSYDNYQPWEVNVFATGYFPGLFAYYSEETRKSGIPRYELERRDDADSRDYELHGLKGTVDVALEDPETISGDIVFDINTKHELKVLPFQISRLRLPGQDNKESKNPKLFINSVQDGQGNELTFVKRGGYGGVVVFPKPIPAGTPLSLRLQFSNKDSIYQLNPTYSALDRGGWLPFVRFSDQITNFDLTTRSPGKFTMIGIGKKLSESRKDGVLTTRWVSPSPVSFPTIIFGEYIEDGPGIKATKKDGTEIPVRVYVDKTTASSINAESIRSESDARNAQGQFESGARDVRAKSLRTIADQAVNALNLYREVYGIDYPFDKLDLVADPLGAFYGQAPASIIYLGFGVFRSEGTVAADFGGGASISKFNKDVVAHETAHQWWGSAVNNANFRNYWFVESLAELSSALFVENVYGRKRYDEKVGDWRKVILDADIMSSVQNGYTLWAGETFSSPIANIYNKGPFAFHTLRETFGDEKFFAFLKKLAQTLKGKEIVTLDIQKVAEESYGGNMDWFFDQWIRGVGIPQYALNYTVRQTEDGKWLVQGTIKQRVVAGKYMDEMKGVYYRGVAPLTFVFADGKRMNTPKPILVQGPETPFQLKLPQEPTEVLFNAGNQILAYDVLVNKSGW